MSLGPFSGLPPHSVYSVSTAPVAMSTAWTLPPR